MAKAKPKHKAKPVAKAKPVPKAKAKPTAKKPVSKKPQPAKKGILKTASKMAGKALAVLSKADKERMKREAAREKERLKKEAQKAKLEAHKEKERLKKEALKEKLEAQKEKERLKKEAQKAKLDAQKEKERLKKDTEKAKVLAQKEAEKAKKLADKEAEKAAKLKAKEDEKARKAAEKVAAKEAKLKAKHGGDDQEQEGSAAPRTGGDEDDEEDFKRIASKGKGGRKYEDVDSHDIERGFKRYSVGELEGKIADEIADLRENFAWKDILGAIGTLEFFIDPKDDSCVEKGCDNIRSTLSWCRLHYIKNWKNIQRRKEILAEGKLQEYIEELISKYPPKFIEAIMSDLSDDKEFYKVLNELNITNEFDFEEEDFEADSDDDDDNDISIERFSGTMRYEDTE